MSDQGKNPICEDMETLRECTAHDLPSREETARAVLARLTLIPREGSIMRFMRSAGARPALATAIGVAVIAIALLTIPIPYTQQVGYQATLSLPSIDADQGRSIANEFAKILNMKECDYNPTAQAGATISARVPMRSRRVLEGLAMAYVQSLAMRGIDASSQVVPVTRRVSGNVYAAATSRLYEFRVNRDGKTNEQIADELRAQFEAAGLPGAVVRVTGEGDQLQMEMEWEAPPGYSSEEPKEFKITIDGNGGADGSTP